MYIQIVHKEVFDLTFLIKLEVIKQEGNCAAGHKIGDQITISYEKNEIDGKICLHEVIAL